MTAAARCGAAAEPAHGLPAVRLVHQDSAGHFQARGPTGAKLSYLLGPKQAELPNLRRWGMGLRKFLEVSGSTPGGLGGLRRDSGRS